MSRENLWVIWNDIQTKGTRQRIRPEKRKDRRNIQIFHTCKQGNLLHKIKKGGEKVRLNEAQYQGVPL